MAPSWHVITGPPCSGKTTLIDELRKRGHAVVPEVARAIIDADLRSGHSLTEIRGDERAFHYRVAVAKLDRDLQLTRTTTLVFDRGLPDSIAFGRHYGWPDPDGFDELEFAELYATVFLLAEVPGPAAPDLARTEASEDSAAIAQALRAVYTDARIPVVELPCVSVQRRVELVSARIFA